MRIGIDLQVLAQKHLTGVGKYALNISRALLELKTEHQFVFFVPDRSVILNSIPDLDSDFHQNDKIKTVILPRKNIPFVTAHWQYAKIMQKAKLDVLFGPANTIPFFYQNSPLPSLSKRGGVGGGEFKSVITIHDLAIYKHPEWFPGNQWFSTKFLVPRSIRKASHIIVPSAVTAGDLMELFGLRQEKITVIPHGVEERFFTPSSSPPYQGGEGGGRYIFFVGTLEPRKNVGRLIEAYQMLPEGILDRCDLVIAGDRGWEPPLHLPLFRKAKQGEKERGSIKFLGYVPDQDLPALYQGAAIFVYPSLYEGFGLPVLEAMAAGVPVVTSRNSAMAEIVTSPGLWPPSPTSERGRGEVANAAILVNPSSVTEIRDAIVKYLSPPSEARGTLSSSGESNKVASLNSRDNAYLSQISTAGQKVARQFTWERAARETLKAITNA